MPTLSHEQTLLIGAVVGPVLFLASVFITGARRRHIGAAVLAAVAYGLATYCWDRLAAVAGWWHYPFDTTATGPVLALDLLAGVVAGGAFGLVGARLTARYGRLGLAAFLLAWTAWGVLHDLAGSALFAGSNPMTFATDPSPTGRRRQLRHLRRPSPARHPTRGRPPGSGHLETLPARKATTEKAPPETRDSDPRTS